MPRESEQNRDQGPYEEGKRAGAHPALVIVGIIAGLWILMWLYVPSSKQKPGFVPAPMQGAPVEDIEAAPVMFKVKTVMPELNAVGILVPHQATESQVAGLLKRFRDARLNGTLSSLLPPTTPGHRLGEHAIADIYVFSDQQYVRPEVIGVLARGAHVPGELYPQAVPFEAAMEQVRGHYRIDLNDTGHPDNASIGFADESGIHSKSYRHLF
jgi:hypothetical protein